MALSREEIAEIAQEVAREVIAKTDYHDPPSIEAGIVTSMTEEVLASASYTLRAIHASDNGDDETSALYEHIAAEEGKHLKDFESRLHKVKRQVFPAPPSRN